MKFRFFILLLFITSIFIGQTENKEFLEADNLYNSQRFSSAFYAYNNLLKKYPNNAYINYKIGACYLASRSQKSKAAVYLEKAIELSASFISQPRKGIDAPPLAYVLLGDAYCVSHKFDPAKDAYQKFKNISVPDKDIQLLEEIEQKIELCALGKELKESVTLPDNLKNINFKTRGAEDINYSKALSSDKSTMIYTLKVPLSKITQPDEESKYYEAISQLTKKDTTPYNTLTLIDKKKSNTLTDTIINILTIGASADGQIILTYRNEKDNANLYISRLKSNNWTTPLKIEKNLNNKGWEPGEYISADGSTLYFVSERPEGYGGKDIFKCTRMENGEWSKAVNLGSNINSAYDDVAPFIHADGVTLFFSSNRTKPTEGYDIYRSTLSGNNNWSKPVAVGYPVDKVGDDAFYQVASKKNIFTHAPVFTPKQLKKMRADSLKRLMENENYVISFKESRSHTLALLKGKIGGSTTDAINHTKITVTDNTTGNILGVYYTEGKSGQYAFILPSGKNNNIFFESENCLFQSQNILVNKETEYYEKTNFVFMRKMEEGATSTLNNIFFDSASANLTPTSKIELNNLLNFLKNNPEIQIKLTNRITAKDQRNYKILSKKRAQVVAAFLIVNGIDKERMKTKGTTMSLTKKQKKNKNKEQNEEVKFKDQELILEIIKIRKKTK